MIDSILQSELEKADNSFYASESLLEKIEEEDISYRLGCRIYCENIKFDVPIMLTLIVSDGFDLALFISAIAAK